jgi:hypothetical protein
LDRFHVRVALWSPKALKVLFETSSLADTGNYIERGTIDAGIAEPIELTIH